MIISKDCSIEDTNILVGGSTEQNAIKLWEAWNKETGSKWHSAKERFRIVKVKVSPSVVQDMRIMNMMENVEGRCENCTLVGLCKKYIESSPYHENEPHLCPEGITVIKLTDDSWAINLAYNPVEFDVMFRGLDNLGRE